MKKFSIMPTEDYLEIQDYKFIPLPDITAYEAALIMDALMLPNKKPSRNSLLKTIIRRWPLPAICRHIARYNDRIEDSFETEVKNAIVAFLEENIPTRADKWWEESINREVIRKWTEGESQTEKAAA